MSKLNLPPFYVGQKVEYVGWRKDLKGSIHTVLNIYKAKCGCWEIESDNLPYGNYKTCSSCKKNVTFIGKVGAANSFRPLEEKPLPLLTFQQIKETEKEEVLILN